MSRIYNIFLSIFLLAATLSCTHNNGDIGPLFGRWALDEMTVDGTPHQQLPDTDTFMQFQGSIVMSKLIDSRYTELIYSVGTWQRDGNTLLLDYTHHDNEYPTPGDNIYNAPTWIMLTSGVVNKLTILSLDKKHMKLQYISPEGATIQYSFHKTF